MQQRIKKQVHRVDPAQEMEQVGVIIFEQAALLAPHTSLIQPGMPRMDGRPLGLVKTHHLPRENVQITNQ